MNARRRLKALEQQLLGGRPAPEQQHRGLAQEIREIDANIRELEAEIAEIEATMPPEEVERRRAEDRAFMASLEGLSLDEAIAGLEAEIAAEEAT